MEKKPIKIEDGRLKEFSTDDTLPNQKDIDNNLLLISRIVSILVDNGFEIDDEDLLDTLNNL